ncbi:shematrin-like protein 2 [Eurosta solidaginis]|uniref:shematrin-like protein 2 n=1 Tax=Eurosta solidaginis TaxID=178769 RepID=UPI0035315F8F
MGINTKELLSIFGIMLAIGQYGVIEGYPQTTKATALQSIADGEKASAVASATNDAETDLKTSETFGFGYYPGIYGSSFGYSGHGLGYGGYGYGSRWGYGGYHGYGGYAGYGGYGGYGGVLYRRPIYPVWG